MHQRGMFFFCCCQSKVLPTRQVMVVYKLRPQVVGKVFQEGFNRCASRVPTCGLRLEIPSVHFRLMAILSGDPGLVGVDLLIHFPFHACRLVVTNAVHIDVFECNRAAPQQSVQSFETHCLDTLWSLPLVGTRVHATSRRNSCTTACHTVHTLDCRRALRKLYKSSVACMNFK